MGNKLKESKLESQAILLGFKTIFAYQNWCLDNGFPTKANKTQRELDAEKERLRSQKANLYLVQSKQGNNKRKLKDFIKHFTQHEPDFFSEHDFLPRGYEAFNELKHLYHSSTDTHFKKQIYNFISNLLNADLEEKIDKQKRFVEVLKNIVKYNNAWVRSPDLWKIKSHNTHRQFVSLVRNLFCLYEMPDFMDKVWFEEKEQYLKWYLHMGLGFNIRACKDLPIPFTKKMAHHFCQAPSNYNINEAIRYGQVLSMGGTPRLVEALKETRLRLFTDKEDFWETVIRWFTLQPMFDYEQVGPIIDYVNNQKYEPITEFVDRVAVQRPPAQPGLTMKDRNPEALIRQVEKWHHQLGKIKRVGNVEWVRCAIKEFNFTEGQSKNKKEWRIRELCSSIELQDEGRQMSHCVSSYSTSCYTGKVSIWSLEKFECGNRTKELTIEITMADKRVVQMRGKRNCMPNENQEAIVRRWAQVAGLKMKGD